MQNREEILEKKREYYRRNKTKMNAYSKKRMKENKEIINKKKRERYEKETEFREKILNWNKKFREKTNYSKKYYQENKEKRKSRYVPTVTVRKIYSDADRYNRILKYREEGLTLVKIGEIEGISYQRVGQILKYFQGK